MSSTSRDWRMLISGKLVEAIDGRWIEAIDPATEAIIGRVPRAGSEEVGLAVAAAERAQPAWAALAAAERARLLRGLATALRGRAEDLTRLEIAATGNTVGKVRADVEKAATRIEMYAGLAHEVKGLTVPATPANLHLTLREPFGVVARIAPFNHPVGSAARVAAALIAGNTVVLKPSEQGSPSVCLFADIASSVLPDGVLNVVTGIGSEAGDALVRHPRIKRISFTGSRATALSIQRSGAEVGIKQITFELGGKNPMIVFADADIEAAIDAAVRGMALPWQGQSCGSISRLFLHASIHDAFLARLSERVVAVRVGEPAHADTEMGPLASRAQYEKVLSYVKLAQDEGAKLCTGGRRPQGARFARGYWLEPAVFSEVRKGMRVAREEIFGPVLSVLRFTDVDEAIDDANGD